MQTLDVISVSSDIDDNRVLRLTFRQSVTDKDRKDLLEAINLKIANEWQDWPAES